MPPARSLSPSSRRFLCLFCQCRSPTPEHSSEATSSRLGPSALSPAPGPPDRPLGQPSHPGYRPASDRRQSPLQQLHHIAAARRLTTAVACNCTVAAPDDVRPTGYQSTSEDIEDVTTPAARPSNLAQPSQRHDVTDEKPTTTTTTTTTTKMKPSTTPLLALLLAATPLSLAAPAPENQVVLGHDHHIPTSTRVITTPTAFTTVPTPTTRTRMTPVPLWKMTTRTDSHKRPAPTPVGQAVWDWLFHPQPPNRAVRPKGEGCFCAGGSTCCYRPDEEIVCGLGMC
ncbi:hypothetical protein B0T18DRAFT_134936 [Schizothecium vesticola]|uniref:Uncharacterized protein n=1 Tax=Schizothecium vesticola TaxID=314040 RepID=A0AA40K4J3_9PEZI|nr:hypothetical protein B0T18DRAFT_134936 [Schizothecium vesticola]